MSNLYKKDKKQKNIIIILITLIALSLALGAYFIFINETNVFKTTDGKFTLKIVDKNLFEDAKRILKSNNIPDEMIESAKPIGYVYLNNDAYIVSNIHEDENYGVYTLFTGFQYNMKILVDKKKGTITENPFDENYGIDENITRFENSYDFIKTDAGYFFINIPEEPGPIVYTTNWKKLGYGGLSREDIKYDSTGIYVYNDFDFNSFKFVGNLIKYDVNGNKIG